MAGISELKAGVVLNYVSIGLHGLVTFLYTPYMLHKLGQSEYGLYSMVASIIGYLTFLDLGFGHAVVRFTARYKAEGKTEEQYYLFGLFFIFYALVSLFVIIGGLVLYQNTSNLFGDTMTDVEIERAKVMMLLLTFNMAFSFLFQIYGAIMTAYERFIFSKSFSIIRLILNTLIMIMLLHVGYKAIAMIVVGTVFNVITILVNYLYCKFKLRIKVKFRRLNIPLVISVVTYSFWNFLDSTMDKVNWRTGQFVLGAICGTVSVSIFSVAIHMMSTYMSFSTAISGVFLPRLTSMVARNSSDREISDLFIRTGRLQFAVTSFIISGFVVFGLPFIKLWIGEEYQLSYFIAVIFFVSLLTPLTQNMGITVLQARNQMKFRSLLYVGICVVSLLGQIILSREYGVIGCAFGVSAALLIGDGVIMNIYYHKTQHLDMLRFWKEIGKMSVVPCVLIVVGIISLRFVSLHSWHSLLLGIALYTLIFIPVFWHFSMSVDEHRLLSDLLKKVFIRRRVKI